MLLVVHTKNQASFLCSLWQTKNHRIDRRWCHVYMLLEKYAVLLRWRLWMEDLSVFVVCLLFLYVSIHAPITQICAASIVLNYKKGDTGKSFFEKYMMGRIFMIIDRIYTYSVYELFFVVHISFLSTTKSVPHDEHTHSLTQATNPRGNEFFLRIEIFWHEYS